METRFTADKRAHFELCALIPEVIKERDVQTTCNILSSKWKHLLTEEGNFENELIPDGKFIVMVFLKKELLRNYFARMLIHAIFFPNVRELLCILAVLPIGSAEAERSFSCLRQIHSWLHSTMNNERLGNLGVLACHGFDIQLSVDQICPSFAQTHHRKM